MRIAGRYFDGKTSTMQPVEVELLDNACLKLILPDREIAHPIRALQISERIGNMQRRIRFEDGAICELNDNDTLDQWLTSVNAQGLAHSVFKLEQRWCYALIALIVVAGVSWGGIRYGLPTVAEKIAYALPTAIDDQLGAESLALLDKGIFKQSELPTEKQDEIRVQFDRIIADTPDAKRYRLEFRIGGKHVGPNAFALPSGVIVITDELIKLAQDPNEVTAVLAHEVGHIVHRHSTRMLLQSSASTLILFALLGDVSAVSAQAASIPALLTQAKYSRQFEVEADNYAYAWFKSQGIASHHFGDLLTRIEEQHGANLAALSYFSSHPRTTERSHH